MSKLTTHRIKSLIGRRATFSRGRLFVLMGACVVVGTAILLLAHAAGPYVTVEAETGTVSGAATAGSDAAASGGQYVALNAPTPTPTPSASPPAGCTNTGKPSASTTGVPAGTSLTVVNGDLTVTTAGTVIDAKDIHGFLIIKANNVTVKRTIVRGRSASGNNALIDVQSGTGIVIQNSEVANDFPAATIDGVWGQNATMSCMNIHSTVDGLKLSSGSRLEYSYVHDLTWFASDPNQSGGADSTHNDTVQILDGTGITVIGNNLNPNIADANSSIQITQDFGALSNVTLTDNWGDGGGCTFNISHKGGAAITINASGNRFGRNSAYNCPILISTQTTLVGSGNVWDDTGQTVPIQQHN